jgi:sugar lactone lactonase YvrE
LTVAARSPRFLTNAVALNRAGTMFLGMPHWAGMDGTPSVVRVAADGALTPFPGGSWNEWEPGKDVADAFVQINALHVFGDDTLWVVDQGAPDRKTALPGAQKLLQFDSKTGKLIRALRFGSDILPEGAQMNDLRIWGSRIYVADSGLGGIVVHDMANGRTLRRLSGNDLLKQAPDRPMRGSGGRVLQDAKGKRPDVGSDMLEISPDGRWLYVSTPSGPFYRVPTALLDDPAVDEAKLAAAVEKTIEIPTQNGTAMDSLGNLFVADAEHNRIEVVAPSGKRAVLVADPRLVNPDAIFIDARRRLYVPATQNERMPDNAGGHNLVKPPFLILTMPLPESVDGIRLGDAIAPVLTTN